MVSHGTHHAAGPAACQPNSVRVAVSVYFRGWERSVLLLSEPLENVGDDLTSFRHYQFFNARYLERARGILLMAESVDREDLDFFVRVKLSLEAIYGDPSFTVALCACITHDKILLDIRDDDGRQRWFSDFNFHSSVLTMVRSSNPIVRRTGRCDNTPARVAPMQRRAA